MLKINRKELYNFFSQYEEIKVVYLFGSYAARKQNNLSDIDIAVLLEDNYTNDIKLELLKGLTGLGYDDIDLVILNQLGILGKYEAVKHNDIIYTKDNFNKDRYFSLVTRRYLDFKPLLEVQRSYLKERIDSGK